MSDYRLLPIPPGLRGPSGESNQIEVDGVVNRVSLYHGRKDKELDWHVHFYLDAEAKGELEQHLVDNGEYVSGEDVAILYCELMLVDDWRRRGITMPPWQATGQIKYDSADLTRPLRLFKLRSIHPAYDLARPVADEPGRGKTLNEHSWLCLHRGRVYMQGLFVRDIGHQPGRLEIHPPDSIAFAVGDDNQTLSAANEDCDWPSRTIRWRVSWFANSNHHRVVGKAALRQPRTTTWYLPLPQPLVDPVNDLGSPQPELLQEGIEIVTEPIQLWDSKNDEWYDSRGVLEIEDAKIEADPRDNQRKLHVSATMDVPDSRGGIIVRDYIVSLKPQVIDPGFDN